jgi:aspartokinase
MEKISINGLKLSSKLVLLNLELSMNCKNSLANLCQLLGDHNVNILFISTTTQSDHQHGIFCIDAEKQRYVEQLIAQAPQFKATVKVVPGVGLLTLFPHQSNLKLVGVVMQNLGNKKIPIYGLASSIAAITFVIDFNRLDDAAHLLIRCLKIPQSVTPLRSILKVRQVDSGK